MLLAWSPHASPAAAFPVEQPRAVLALWDSTERPRPSATEIHQLAEMVLNYLGLTVDYLDVASQPLPDDAAMARYRGVLTWFRDERLPGAAAYCDWLARQAAAGRRLAILGNFGAYLEATTGQPTDPAAIRQAYAALGAEYQGLQTDNPALIEVVQKASDLVEFERPLNDPLLEYRAIRSVDPANRVYLQVRRTDRPASESDVVFTGPYGGLALAGYEYHLDPATGRRQWRLDPFRFFEEALGTAGIPRPDVTTLNGSRTFYTHIDGDGFNNISEIDRVSLSAEIILERIIRRYRLPTTASVIVNDVDPATRGGQRGLRVARALFAEPNVEPASHTWSHPFDWVNPGSRGVFGQLLEVTQYDSSRTIDLAKEVDGSIAYIDERLLPVGKQTAIILWSGATNPPEEAIERVHRLGIREMNGGDSRYDLAANSVTTVAPLTLQVGRYRQHYTSAANDNIYTNGFSGPYSGMLNLIASLERTGTPRRLTPINVYYHFYSGQKTASLDALIAVHDWALRQPIAPILTSEFVAIVDGFFSTRLIQEDERRWRIAENGALRTIRFDQASSLYPDLAASTNVLGYLHQQGALYIHLGGEAETTIVLANTPPALPHLRRASHRITRWRGADGAIDLVLEGTGPKVVELAGLAPNAAYEVQETLPSGRRTIATQATGTGTLRWSSQAAGPRAERVELQVRPAGANGPAGMPWWQRLLQALFGWRP